MARTKADAAKKAGGKAPRKAQVLNRSVATNSPARAKGDKYSGGNPYCPRPTPEWQVPITKFLNKNQGSQNMPQPQQEAESTSGSTQADNGSAGSSQNEEGSAGSSQNEEASAGSSQNEEASAGSPQADNGSGIQVSDSTTGSNQVSDSTSATTSNEPTHCNGGSHVIAEVSSGNEASGEDECSGCEDDDAIIILGEIAEGRNAPTTTNQVPSSSDEVLAATHDNSPSSSDEPSTSDDTTPTSSRNVLKRRRESSDEDEVQSTSDPVTGIKEIRGILCKRPSIE